MKNKKLNLFMGFVKKHLGIILLLLAVDLISVILAFSQKEKEIVIEKNGYGGEKQQVDFLLKKGETTENITIEVRPRQFTKEEAKQRMEEAFTYLDIHIKGDNDSLSYVTKSLDFSLDYEEYPFNVEISPEDYVLIDEEGNIQNKSEELTVLGYTNEQQTNGIHTTLKIHLQYEDISSEKIYDLVVFPKKEGVLEKQFAKVKEQIGKEEDKALYDERFILPNSIEDVVIARTDTGEVKPVHVIVMGLLVAGLLLLRERENDRLREKKRQELLLRSYPWFVNELVLLFGAGMQMKNILTTLIQEYEKGRTKVNKPQEDYRDVLIEELKKASHSLELGMAEEQVYYQLGRRLKLPCYIKLMTLLEQNVKRGTKGLTDIFEQEEMNALEDRKNLARRYGEEAGTKLLGPMILLLLIIMLIVMIPAFMSFY